MNDTDKKLWNDLAVSVKPLKQKNFYQKDSFNNKNYKIKTEFILDFENFSHKERIVNFRADLKLNSCDRINTHTYKKINKNFIYDAKIDLHGYGLEEAFTIFQYFIKNNFNIGARCLLVITGIGKKEKNTGVIRKNFMDWIKIPEIQDKILYCGNANINDGGKGAFYLMLRKK